MNTSKKTPKRRPAIIIEKQLWSGLWMVFDFSTGVKERTELFIRPSWSSAMKYADSLIQGA